MLNLDLPAGATREQRLKTLGLIKKLNQANLQPGDTELEARINSYDLAFKMQTEAPPCSTSRASRPKPWKCTVSESR